LILCNLHTPGNQDLQPYFQYRGKATKKKKEPTSHNLGRYWGDVYTLGTGSMGPYFRRPFVTLKASDSDKDRECFISTLALQLCYRTLGALVPHRSSQVLNEPPTLIPYPFTPTTLHLRR